MSKETPLERSLSSTSTCSSDQSKEESDASDKSKSRNAAETIKVEASDSSLSNSSNFSYLNPKLESENEISKLESAQIITNEICSSTKPSDSEFTNPIQLLSIKEEIIETEHNELELEISKTDEINASFSSVDEKTSSKKVLNSSRKNSLAELRKSSRKSSLVESSPELRKNDEQTINSAQLNTEIEVSFADDETAFATTTSGTLSTFDTGTHTETSAIVWESICSLSKSQANIEKPTIITNVDGVNRTNKIEEISHKDVANDVNEQEEEPKVTNQGSVTAQELKEKLIVNKENAIENDEGKFLNFFVRIHKCYAMFCDSQFVRLSRIFGTPGRV